jgi:hypothetical protein
MNTRIFLIVFLSALGLMIIGSIVGNILESKGILNAATIGAKGIIAWKLAYFVLFCVMAFAFVPVVVRLFISLQIKIGNGEFFLIKFFQAHEQAIVYGFWIFMVIGFGIIFALARDDILKDFT